MSAHPPSRRFWATATALAPTEPNVWPCAEVDVFDAGRRIGGYHRNLAGWADSTFEPFQWEGEWFALYSPDYTSTRVMSLPDCRDIGGEEHCPSGFCPVQYHAPRYREITQLKAETGHASRGWAFNDGGETQENLREGEFGPWVTVPTAFVAGCQWGDDSTWKLECIDLCLAAQGQIVRTARFGHVELPRAMSLTDAVRLDRHPPHWDVRATVIRQERRDVATGALIDPFDE